MNYDVLLVSRFELVRTGERRGLETIGGLPADRICEANSKEGAIQTIDGVVSNGGAIGAIVTDLSLGRRSDGLQDVGGLELLKYVAARGLGTRVIITSSGHPEHYADAVKLQGVFGYFQKGGRIDELAALVRDALATKQQP